MRLLKIALVALVATPALWISLLILGFDPSTISLHLQIAANKDTLFSETYQCGEYYWRVQEREEIVEGSFGLGTVTHIGKRRDLILGNTKGVIAEFKPGITETIAYNSEFPAGEAFLHAYVFGEKALSQEKENVLELRRQFLIPNTRISETNFREIASCLNNNLATIEPQLNEVSPVKYPVGWVVLVDSSVKRDEWSGHPAYECNDGSRMVTLDRIIHHISKENKNQKPSPFGSVARDFELIGIIGLDGSLYSGFFPDAAKEQKDFPTLQCVNSNGQTLKAIINSIPDRITTLNRVQ